MAASLENGIFANDTISPYEELLAYECLYSQQGSSLQKVIQSTVLSGRLPHEALEAQFGWVDPGCSDDVRDYIDKKLGSFSVAINRTPTWPDKLKDSARPTPLIYFRGDIGLLDAPNVAIVGARKASSQGIARASSLARSLADNDVVVTTGLAAGIDTAAARSAIENGGKTIGVIGTPIDEYYPKQNRALQDLISKEHLLVSQVPLYRYAKQPFKTKRYYFPERNELMAAISDATVIVEASDTSGTLSQARACLHQGLPLFIMRSCAENPAVSWPADYVGKDGVEVLDSPEQVLEAIRHR